jgi:hypothetical protein
MAPAAAITAVTFPPVAAFAWLFTRSSPEHWWLARTACALL